MGLISSRRLGDVLDFVGVRCEPLPTVRLWPAGPYVLVRFISLTDLVQSFLYLTVAVLTGVASIRQVAFSRCWTKNQLVDELCRHQCSVSCLVFVFEQRRSSRKISCRRHAMVPRMFFKHNIVLC